MSEPVLLDLHPGRLTEYGKRMTQTDYGLWLLSEYVPIAGGASFGNAVENKILDHITNQTSYTMPTPSLGLWTTTPDDTYTAASGTELTYTTYARQAISGTNMSPAAAGSVTNDVAITFPAVSAGGGTVIGWVLCSSASGAGDNIAWGTATSTVISTTQTPPTVAIGGFVITLD
jgi:hypothetical protein